SKQVSRARACHFRADSCNPFPDDALVDTRSMRPRCSRRRNRRSGRADAVTERRSVVVRVSRRGRDKLARRNRDSKCQRKGRRTEAVGGYNARSQELLPLTKPGRVANWVSEELQCKRSVRCTLE